MRNAYGWVALSFILAVTSAQWWPFLPSTKHLGALLLVLWGVRKFRPHCSLLPAIFGFALGTTWLASVGHSYQSWQLPEAKIKQNVIIQGVVIDSSQSPDVMKLVMDISEFEGNPAAFRAKINWYSPELSLQQGQTVQLCVRLKPPHGLQNPTGFNYWRWLVSRQIQATGYVVSSAQNRLMRPSLNWSTRLQYRLNTIPKEHLKWLNAILLADRSTLGPDDWLLLQRTGVAHLFTLSGLHMGVIFLLFVCLAKPVVFTAFYPCNYRYKQQGHALSYGLALLASWLFVLVCGSPITLVRAAIALSLFAIVLLFNRRLSVAIGFIYVLAACLLVYPLSILGISLYLSFFAVASLLFIAWRFPARHKSTMGKMLSLVRLQILLSVFMLIITGAVF